MVGYFEFVTNEVDLLIETELQATSSDEIKAAELNMMQDVLLSPVKKTEKRNLDNRLNFSSTDDILTAYDCHRRRVSDTKTTRHSEKIA